MKSLDDIRSMFRERKTALGPVHARACMVRDTYNGDVVVPLPEIDENEQAAVANLVQLGLDQLGQRIASTMPAIEVPPLRRGIKKSEDYARRRRLAMLGWHQESRLNLKLRRRARWLLAYASAPVLIRPDKKLRVPRWDLREPLTSYPPQNLDPDEIHPPDCIFTFTRSPEWLNKWYPEQFARLARNEKSASFTLLHYVDDEETVLAVLGDKPESSAFSEVRGTEVEELRRFPNKAGVCPAVVPGRVTLDRPMGQFDGIIGIYQTQAKLMALNVIATERAVFPEQWLVAPEGRNPQVISVPNARKGEIGEVRGGTIETQQVNPGVFTAPTMDRLEYAERHTAGIPASFGGSGPSNVRTGKALDTIQTAVVDFPIQEAQELFEASLHQENVIAIETAKAYFGNESRSFYVRQEGNRADYTPDEHFETTDHRVSYAYTGADANNLNIVVGQKIGMGALSKRRGMELDPMIPDVDAEHDVIVAEALEAAFLSSIQNQAADPAGPYQPEDLARLVELVTSNKMELFEAVQQVQREAQEREAAQAQTDPADPNAQPGLAMPGAPGAPPEAIPEPGPSMGNLNSLLMQLRGPQMQSKREAAGVR